MTATNEAGRWPGWVRAVSLVLAAAPYLILFVYPYAIGRTLSTLDHSVLPLVLIAAAGAFAVGFGFRFERHWLATICSPPVTWPLILVGLWMMWRY